LVAPLAGAKREIVGETGLLPAWLRPFPDPLRPRRRIWLSPFGPPLRGWHVQQLRRIAVAARLPEEVVLSCDSDVVFVRPFDVAALRDGAAVRFHRVPGEGHAVIAEFAADHRRWSRRAGELLGIAPEPPGAGAGYIATGIAWRTDTVRALTQRIQAVGNRPWMRRLVASRALSECTLYGRFVDEAENRPDRHRPDGGSICRVYWAGAAMDARALAAFVAELAPHEVAIGIQSFTNTDPGLIRRAAGLG
jgi:hypothetical protein